MALAPHHLACAALAVLGQSAQVPEPQSREPQSREPQSREPLLREPPPGVRVAGCTVAGAGDIGRIAQHFGAALTRVTNSVVVVHGASIRLNVIACASEAGADAVHASLAKLKGAPFLVRVDPLTIVEYVGEADSGAVAQKASWELGLSARPKRLRYVIRAELAAVDEASYMDCNPLFSAFLQWQGEGDAAGRARVEAASAGFRFGRSLTLRAAGSGAYAFAPVPTQVSCAGATSTYRFEALPERLGVPYVTAIIDLTLDDTGFTPADAPGASLTSATGRWPADDEHVAQLAARIIGDAEGSDARVERLLRWLTPGRNLRFEGRTGSRWGTLAALRQGYGHCWDFSDAFVTLARASGIPARQVAGWLYGASGHVWAEYWSAERGGWQQVDPTGGGGLQVGLYHVPYFTTEDGEMPIVYLSLPAIELR